MEFEFTSYPPHVRVLQIAFLLLHDRSAVLTCFFNFFNLFKEYPINTQDD
jgi:hypothetical protein